MVIWTLAVYVIVQQFESNLILPVIVGSTVKIPPAVGLFAVIALGVLFGPLGVLFAYPLAVVADVAVRRLYVRETLGEEVEISGEVKGAPQAAAGWRTGRRPMSDMISLS